MKRIGLNPVDWKHVGAVLANSGSDEQLDFFRSFIKETQSWGTKHQIHMQLAEVNKDLTEEERDIISMLGYQGDD